ncbi:MAG: hypothetical protein EON93_01960 [Burkholderiales bacterium]|nr:MAG: hypothetical protein EON93_01960 [Burkholderiales bacterium]
MQIVLLARHYPPAVSGGAKRPYLLAHALRKAGQEVLVCAPSLPDNEPGWAVHHPHRDPPTQAGIRKKINLRGVAREWVLWPDPDIRWSMRAARIVAASGVRPDWVISTSPPESLHVAGNWLARKTGARWLADFRDLWLENPHRRERAQLQRRLGERLIASSLLPRASIVTAVDDVVAREAQRFGGKNVRKMPHFTPDLAPQSNTSFLPHDMTNVVHVGSIGLSDPVARISHLLEPFEVAWRKNPALRLHFVGRLTDSERDAVAASAAVSAIKLWGVVPLDQAYGFMREADALAFIGSSKMHVPPSKIADYLMYDTPIVAAGTGPWRQDPRTPTDDAATSLASLTKHAKRQTGDRAMTASEAASLMLRWMSEFEK